MKFSYKPQGVCSAQMNFEIEDGVLKDVEIIRGCSGNTQGISSLCKGMKVNDIIDRLEGIDCNGRGTSCPDQLAKALKAALEQM